MEEKILDDNKDLVAHLLFEDSVLNDFEELEEIQAEPMNFIPEELEKIPHAKSYSNCPNCGKQADTEPYLTKVFQEDLLPTYDPWSGQHLETWIEVHRCWNCQTLFQFQDSTG